MYEVPHIENRNIKNRTPQLEFFIGLGNNHLFNVKIMCRDGRSGSTTYNQPPRSRADSANQMVDGTDP
jgi:hypothetical protein